MLSYASLLLFIIAVLIIIRSILDKSKEYFLGFLCIIFCLYIISYQTLFIELSAFYGAILFNHFAPIYLLVGPFLLWYCQYIIGDYRPFTWKDALHLLPAFIHLVSILPYFFVPFETKMEIVKNIYYVDGYFLNSQVNEFFSKSFIHLVRLVTYLAYIGYCTLFIIENKKKIKRYIYNWLLFSIFLIIVQVIVFAIFAFLLFHNNQILGVTESSLATSIGLVEITLVLICLFIYPYEYISSRPVFSESTQHKVFKGTVNESAIVYDKLLKDRIRVYFDEQKPYLNPDFNAMDLTIALNVPQHQISACLRNEFAMSFTEYRTKARVDYAIHLLRSDEASKITMEAIGQKSGFHSKSVFFKSFKDVTGVSPSIYLKGILE
jgi:AraC-like DNA-binding protein